jgi:sulfur carrier protein ThiS
MRPAFGVGGHGVRIRIRPIGLIRRYVQEEDRDFPDGLTSQALIRQLNIPEGLKMVSLVNGHKRDLDSPLHDGDEVKLVTLMTGG